MGERGLQRQKTDIRKTKATGTSKRGRETEQIVGMIYGEEVE